MKKLTVVGLVVVAGQMGVGIICGQTLPPPPAYTYDVVSVHPSSPDESGSQMIGPGAQGGLRTRNTPVMQLLAFAYNIRGYQLAGAPGWVSSEHFDVSFTPDKSEITPGPGIAVKQLEDWGSRQRQRMQAVLRDRFGLVLHVEDRELPVYALTLAKGGHKLSSSPDGSGGPSMRSNNRGLITATGASMKMFTDLLSSLLDRPVTNETGLDGSYDFKLQWTPDSLPVAAAGESVGVADGPSIFTALTEQLGLRLESTKGTVPVCVIDKIEKPSAN